MSYRAERSKERGVERIANYINNGGLVEIKEYAAISPLHFVSVEMTL